MVIEGFQSLSSLTILKHTLPEGKILGWKSVGTNLQCGGLLGYSSGKVSVNLYKPPSQGD